MAARRQGLFESLSLFETAFFEIWDTFRNPVFHKSSTSNRYRMLKKCSVSSKFIKFDRLTLLVFGLPKRRICCVYYDLKSRAAESLHSSHSVHVRFLRLAFEILLKYWSINLLNLVYKM